MEKLGTVESTLFVPMLGRIYASEHFPHIFYDEKALSLKPSLPKEVIDNDTQNQYTYLASACRSANMDRFIQSFLKRRTDGVIVQLGCGLETTFDRNDNGKSRWYSIDLPDVISFRKRILPPSDREMLLAADVFSEGWIKEIQNKEGNAPLLITASGLFYYFKENQVIDLLKKLCAFRNVEIVFDAVSKSGMKMMKKKWMKKVGHEDAKMFFYVDSAVKLANQISSQTSVIAEEEYYHFINKHKLGFTTKISMMVSDAFHMVKMIHLKLKEDMH